MPEDDRIIKRAAREVNDLFETKCDSMRRRRLSIALACVSIALLSFVVVGCTAESRSDRMHRQAKKYVKAGELDQAVQLYDRIVNEYPDTSAAERSRKEVVV